MTPSGRADRVMLMRARTREGLEAKARALLCYSQYAIDGVPLGDNHDALLGWSLARDLLAGVARA